VIKARFGHVNLIARDWRGLSSFYERVFGMELVPPLRNYAGDDLSAGTGVVNASLEGGHWRLPGLGSDGPTLEIYQYGSMPDAPEPAANRPGFGHLALVVDDVAEAAGFVVREGGSAVGSVVTLQTADGRRVTWAYVRDPEGNILELQAWSTG
jgi:catechol 2,3-dioxygenase-like lactoylglutathione lyase family enzyme